MELKTNYGMTYKGYSYNNQTGRLSLKDGSEDVFCRFFNDEITKMDAQQKADITDVIQNIKCNNSNGLNAKDIWELEFHYYDAFRSMVKVEDFSIYCNKCIANPNLFKSETDGFEVNYTYKSDLAYSEGQNSISFIPGKEFQIGNKKICIEDNMVRITDENDEIIKSSQDGYTMREVFDIFIRCANDQITTSNLYSQEMIDDVLDILTGLGIDTTVDFTVNERKFLVTDEKQIVAVDTFSNPLTFLGITKKQQEIALERYNEILQGTYE